MPQDVIIAIVSREQFSSYRQLVDECFEINEFESQIPSCQSIQAENLHLIIDGEQGRADLNSNGPITLRDLGYSQVAYKVDVLKTKGYKFKSIHLISSYSAIYIPLFRELLTDDGMIFCETLSLIPNVYRPISSYNPDDKDYLDKWFEIFAFYCKTQLKELDRDYQFISEAVYTNTNKTLHRFNVGQRLVNFKEHTFSTADDSSEHISKKSVYTIKSYLESNNIVVADASIEESVVKLPLLAKYLQNKSTDNISLALSTKPYLNNYSFVLKALTLVAAVSLLTVAIVFLPELGIASTVGIVSAGAYAITASSAALSVGGIGFFGYMVQHDCASSSDFQLTQSY